MSHPDTSDAPDSREAVRRKAASLDDGMARTSSMLERSDAAAMLRRLIDRAEAAEGMLRVSVLERDANNLIAAANAAGYARGVRAAVEKAKRWGDESPSTAFAGCGWAADQITAAILALLPADTTKGTDDE